jgi:hypothetical protein
VAHHVTEAENLRFDDADIGSDHLKSPLDETEIGSERGAADFRRWRSRPHPSKEDRRAV